MHPDAAFMVIRNILLVHVLTALTIRCNDRLFEQALLRLWKTLNRPLLPKKTGKTNHQSGKFWEIDMTNFEP